MSAVDPISAVLIVLDEEEHVAEALATVRWADEMLVVDGGSRDRTVERARDAGARVLERPFRGFVDQKNFAVEAAAHDWIFSLDADERVSDELRREIEALRRRGFDRAGYRVPRRTQYLGRWLRGTDWARDRQLRLFDRRRARWAGGRVHESVRCDGPVGALEGTLLHYPYRDVAEHLATINRYTSLAARELYEAGRRASLLAVLGYPPLVFLKNYVLRLGFRDGSVGLVVSALNAVSVFAKYAKLWELGRTEPRGRA